MQAKHRGGKLQKVQMTVSSKFMKLVDVAQQVSVCVGGDGSREGVRRGERGSVYTGKGERECVYRREGECLYREGREEV